jgi:hypothetical protein
MAVSVRLVAKESIAENASMGNVPPRRFARMKFSSRTTRLTAAILLDFRNSLVESEIVVDIVGCLFLKIFLIFADLFGQQSFLWMADLASWS